MAESKVSQPKSAKCAGPKAYPVGRQESNKRLPTAQLPPSHPHPYLLYAVVSGQLLGLAHTDVFALSSAQLT